MKCQTGIAGSHLEIHSVFVDLALVLIIALCVVEHDIDIAHEMINGLVLLSLLLSLCNVRGCRYVDLFEQ